MTDEEKKESLCHVYFKCDAMFACGQPMCKHYVAKNKSGYCKYFDVDAHENESDCKSKVAQKEARND